MPRIDLPTIQFSDDRVIVIMRSTTDTVQASLGYAPADPVANRPARVFVDLSPAVVAVKREQVLEVADSHSVRQVRIAQFDRTTVRVVADINGIVERQLMRDVTDPHQWLLSLADISVPPAQEGIAKAADNRAAFDSHDAKDIATIVQAAVQPMGQEHDSPKRRVVIDPGHGGHDHGARGKGGTYEKDVVLAIALHAAEQLRQAGVDVLLTRHDDTYIPLPERTAFANDHDADVFVSVHANAVPQQHVRGVETYYLNTTDDRYALRLAAVENNTSEQEVTDLHLILADLSTRANTHESATLANQMQKHLIKRIRPINPAAKDHGAKASLFYVLLGTRMPSVLVETAFLSNPDEAALLRKKSYQKALATAIADAILAHVRAPIALVRP